MRLDARRRGIWWRSSDVLVHGTRSGAATSGAEYGVFRPLRESRSESGWAVRGRGIANHDMTRYLGVAKIPQRVRAIMLRKEGDDACCKHVAGKAREWK